jgi:outer membrane protein W
VRKLSIVLVVAFTSSAFAQQKNTVAVFVTNPGINIRSTSGTNVSSGIGLAFSRTFTPRISGELAIASESHRTYPYIVGPNGSIVPVAPRGFRSYPIDATVRYHFANETRWKPFVGIGAHYIGAPRVGSEFRYQNHFGPEIVGGTVFQIGRSIGIVLDAKVYVGDREQYDTPFRPSIGLNWRF